MKERELPFVFSLPHCSSRIPPEIRRGLALSEDEIEESTDVGTAEVFGTLPAVAVLCASWSRLTVDLNRHPAQRDRKGIVALTDYGGRDVFRPGSIPDEAEVERRIHAYYWPYHHRLREALESPAVRVLFDCHSLYGVGPAEAPDRGLKRKDITLSNNGDTDGCPLPSLGHISCATETLQVMKKAFEESGFSVSINRPYSGGYITTHYGHTRADHGMLAVQIEINQNLFCRSGSLEVVPESAKEVREQVLCALWQIAGRVA
ncbi:MAG: N-formylglutamate amidohydrolase [Thermodesulfobacteriota bacterium]